MKLKPPHGQGPPDDTDKSNQIKRVDPLDLLDKIYVPGITSEEISDMMTEKPIMKGEKITPVMKNLMETSSELAIRHAEGNDKSEKKTIVGR